MRTLSFCTLLLLVATGATATGPTVEAETTLAPPDIPAEHGGCGYFYWDNGDVLNGELPGYRYRPCYPADGVAASGVAAALAPPDIPPNHSGCGYFYWDNGDVKNGELPGYRYRHCL